MHTSELFYAHISHKNTADYDGLEKAELLRLFQNEGWDRLMRDGTRRGIWVEIIYTSP